MSSLCWPCVFEYLTIVRIKLMNGYLDDSNINNLDTLKVLKIFIKVILFFCFSPQKNEQCSYHFNYSCNILKSNVYLTDCYQRPEM